MARVRVVTLNLWGDKAPLNLRIEAAARGLRQLLPDVVFLQEVRVGDNLPNTAEWLATRLGVDYVVAYAAATRGPAGTWGAGSEKGEEGLAILARHPIGKVSHVELPEARPTERRILLSASIDVSGTPVMCHTTHLHWRLGDGLARERQVVAIDDLLRQTPEALHIVGGDFNSVPDSDEIRFLTGRHTLAGRRTFYQDAFDRAHRQTPDPGHTWSSRNPNTEPLAWLDRDRRIDYLFVSPERPESKGRVLDCRVVLDAPDEGDVWPSDHFGLLCDIMS